MGFVIVSIIIFLVLAGGVIAFYVVKSQKVVGLNRKGLQFKDWEMWDDAIRCFKRAAELDANHALSYYNLGFVLYFGKNLTDAAIKVFELAITRDKKLAPAYYALGHVLFHGKGALDEAENYLMKAVQIDPALAQVHNTLGLLEIKREDWKKAIDHFQTAVSINEAFESAYCNLSIALIYQGKNSEALESAQKYADLNPHSALAQNNLGNIYGSCGMKTEAIETLQLSAALNPNDWNVYFWLGCLRLQLKKHKEAIASFQEALHLRGDFALAHYNLALCFEQDGNKSLAKKHIDRAIELNPALGENLI